MKLANLVIGVIFWLFVFHTESALAVGSPCSSLTAVDDVTIRTQRIALRPHIPQIIALNPAPSERIDWFIDGVLVQSSEQSQYCLSFPEAGNHTLEIRLAYDNQVLKSSIDVTSYSNIEIGTMTPKEEDSSSESFTIMNKNQFPVRLIQWSLRSLVSKTQIALNTTIEAQDTFTMTTKNKLNNSGGSYGLYNESDQLVDIINYSQVEAGDVIRRDGIYWRQPDHSHVKKTTQTREADEKAGTRVEVAGVVVLPNGRTIDITTDGGEKVRIVLHPSYTGFKPRLEKGDQIFASGIWKRSKRGWYVSVREGDIFLMLYEHVRKTSRKTGSSHNTTYPNIHGASQVALPNMAVRMPISLAEMSIKLPPPTPLWWIHTIINLIGVGLFVPFSRRKTL